MEIPITFVGLRPGEKLYEELVGRDENVQPSSVEKINRVKNGQHPDSSHLLKKLVEFENASVLKNPLFVAQWLQSIVPTFHPADIHQRESSSATLLEQVGTAR